MPATHGWHPRHRCQVGYTALKWALDHGRLEMAALLIEHGAKVNIQGNVRCILTLMSPWVKGRGNIRVYSTRARHWGNHGGCFCVTGNTGRM